MSANPRIADYAINEQFINRWSPRAFTAEPISEQTLLSFRRPRAGRLRPTTHSLGASCMPAVTRRTGSATWASSTSSTAAGRNRPRRWYW